MRLLVSGFILAVTAIDFALAANPGNGLEVASLAAGILLALSVVADHLRLSRPEPPAPPEPADPSLLP